jgi:iron complex transport system substrate-binding protein
MAARPATGFVGRAAGAACAALAAALALSAAPQRIVSLVPATTEMLFAIGAGERVAGVGSFDAFPPDVARLPRVGALLDPDLERILSLRPDLVVLYASQTDLQEQLERAGIPTFAYRHGGLTHVMATIRELGRRTDDAAGAERVAADLERRIDAIRRRVAGRPKRRTMLVFGREPGALRNVYVSGGVGFLHDMLEAAGGENVFADVRRESVQVTSEQMLARSADVILELRYGEATGADPASDREAWQRLSSLPAVRDGRVHLLAGSDLVIPGPRVAAATERFARTLHPDAF